MTPTVPGTLLWSNQFYLNKNIKKSFLGLRLGNFSNPLFCHTVFFSLKGGSPTQKRLVNEKKIFPKFGNGKGMKKFIPMIRKLESEAFIPTHRSLGSLGTTFSAHKFLSISYIPVASSKSKQAGVQCCWQRRDPKESLPCTWESRSLCDCQIQPWSIERHGLSIEINDK